MLADPDVEMIVIALPLWLHAPVAIEAMKAGKHVFTEKLMAHSVAECKEMCRVARETNKLLAVGHQRHYSVLYDNANFLRPERRARRRPPHPGPLAPQQRPAAWSPRTRTATPSTTPRRACPRYVRDDEGQHRLPAIAGSGSIPEQGHEHRLRQVRLQEPGRADQLAALQPHRRRADGRAGQPPARRLLDLPGQEAPAGRHRRRRHVLLQGRPRGRRPRLHDLRVPRAQDDEGPGGRHLLVDQHQLVRRLRRDGHGLAGDDDRQPGEGDPALQGSGQRLRVAARPASSVETRGQEAGARDQPEPGRPERRRRRWAAWPRPTPRAAIARSSSTSPTASATATPRTTTTTRSTSPAAAARSPWPTPSSR